MTTKEMIEVMQAYEDGKTIECRSYETDIISHEAGWGVIDTPRWNWQECEYRVKEEPKYRPYQNKAELLDDLAYKGNNYHNIWLKCKIDDSLSMITEYSDKRILTGTNHIMLSNAFEIYTFEDGTPFGIKDKL